MTHPRARSWAGLAAPLLAAPLLAAPLAAAPLAAGATPAAAVTTLTFDARALPPAIAPKGREKHKAGLHWRDARGDNLLLLSARSSSRAIREAPRERETSRYLYARHYRRATSRGAWRLLREVRDKGERCELDLTAEFVRKSLSVTDLDRDGVGEATFAYKIGCRSDVSPVTLKLLLLEDGRKRILRGQTLVKISPTETVGGHYKVDPSFRRGPKAFLRHAKKIWHRIKREF